MIPRLHINAVRLQQRIDTLSQMTLPDKPWERTAFSDLHIEARAWLTCEMQRVGLETTIDAAGNLIGRAAGSQNGVAPIAIGSHSDTVPEGGRFDGAAGVLAALEVAETLYEAGHRLRHPFEVIDFLGEEPNRYGMSCVGSRGMIGYLTKEMLGYEAFDGTTLAEGIAKMGGDPSKLIFPLRRSGETAAFLEMHIEQARVLESTGDDIGVVTSIVGIARLEVTVQGVADHAGATPMSLRKDALTAAAQMVVEFETRAADQSNGSLVATVGKINVSPNASNAVPGRVDFTLEMRSDVDQTLQDYIGWAKAKVGEICTERGLQSELKIVGQSSPIEMNSAVQAAIFRAATAEGYTWRSMPSGAGHDAAYMARIAPGGMVFIPCLQGRSHCPEEYATPEQLAKGTQTILGAVLTLDEELN